MLRSAASNLQGKAADLKFAGPRYTAFFGNATLDKEAAMPKYVIEREIPGAGKLSANELKAISQKSCGVLRQMGPQIQWLESLVTDDKVYCVYVAPDAEAVRRHAELGGFPANRISEVKQVIDPTTAE